MKAIAIEAGDRFGRLVVVREMPRAGARRVMECLCDCGTRKAVKVGLLRKGTQSCGCFRSEKTAERGRAFRTHGEAANRTPEYAAWQSMIRRCTGVNGPKYHLYGGRGISVCDRWRDSYEAFLADVGRRPGSGYSLDRIDANGNYEPGNVRWADIYTQNRNRRDRRAA